MSTNVALHGNPFAALLDPSAVVTACQNSKPLKALRSAIHRPLDKPKLYADSATAEFDAAIDLGKPVAGVEEPTTSATSTAAYATDRDMEPLVLSGSSRWPANV